MSNNYEDGGIYYDPDETMFNNDEDGGLYFNPEDQELIKYHLLVPKLETYLQPKSKDEECEDFIVMKNVYDKEPWLLDHTNHPLFRKNEWFYFVTRTQVSVKNIGRGRNSKRRIAGDNDGGSWKPNAKKYIEDEEEEKTIIGKKQTLKFTKSENNKRQKRRDGTSAAVPGSNSSWIMNEEVEAVDVTHDAEEDGTGELVERFARTGLDDQQTTEKDDQQEPPMYALSQSSDPPARLGNKSLPIEVDDDEDEEQVMNQELEKHLFKSTESF
ncbi:hypothetical protein Bca4012_048552 [Brassica carinata]|uniref:NAC domain-containing protein n=1 Tax=Brassica carinata TaxID=52824 RepID=A0A8X7R2I8_BRACI|nr:hypothetical protein Bca52824_051492 [Brassica carinata]